ncbi:hypothetical protein EZX95_14780 [Salmonella enterica subsp. enterica serovar Java]|nr:hypothetical protein [Salmonella enterica subsp. enterica serovar Java]
MNSYIRDVLLVNPTITEGNIDISSLEIAVNNYPKHEQAIVRVEVDSGCGKDIIGIVQRIYIANNCLYGDIKFTRDWKFVVTKLIYNPFPLATIAGVINVPDLTYLDKVDFISHESNACSDAIDLNSIVGEQEYAYWLFPHPFYNNPMEDIQSGSAVRFNKKYDNEKSGLPGYVNTSNTKPISKSSEKDFTPVLKMKLNDKGLLTVMSINGKSLSHMYSGGTHAGKLKTNSEDVFHLQELHTQFHRYIWRVLLSGTSSSQG